MNAKTPRKPAAKHPTQGAVPEIDRGAEEAEVVRPEADAPADAPMPTMENTNYLFRPGQGTSILDIKEIVLMQLLQISGGPQVDPGALRHQILSGERYNQLSPEAQKWFQAIATQAPDA